MGLFDRNRRERRFVTPTPEGGWPKPRFRSGRIEIVSRRTYPYLPSKPTGMYEDIPERLTSEERLKPPRPEKLYHLDPQIFEEYCASWARWLGYEDAETTRYTQDGGIDITSSEMVAQVKFQALPVAVGPIRELNGVREPQSDAVFFSLNGYTAGAINEARRLGVRLLVVRPLDGELEEIN